MNQDTPEMPDDQSPIYILGLNINKSKAHYECANDRLERVAQGIYLNANLSPNERKEVLIKNAARIAVALLPSAILAGSSAFHRGSVEGYVMVATPRGGKSIDVGGVLTIVNTKTDLEVGMNREVDRVSINDTFGEHSIKRVADEMLIIKNFQPSKTRPRTTYLNNMDLNKVVERCVRVLGGRDAFQARIESLARAHGMSHYMKQINSFIDGAGSYTQAEKHLEAYRVFWHKSQVATLSNDGHIWSFEYEPNIEIQLSMHEKKGRGSPPSFLGSLLPEVGMKAGNTMEDNLGDFSRGSRYISNITVQPFEGPEGPDIIVDVLDGELNQFTGGSLEFTGRACQNLRGVMGNDELLGSLHRDPSSPRMSGMQIKLAANLSRDGLLTSANGKAFTHMVKIVGSNPKYQSMCSMEWYSLTIAKACRLDVEDFVVADIGGYGPSLIVERFDIRKDLNDRRMILTEDFWSIEGMVDNNHKYHGELMNVADVINKRSTNKEKDARSLLTQAAFSWLTWNGDLHLKNLLMIKEAADPRKGFDTIRMSPMYDVLCTQVFPEDAKSSAIGLAGKRVHTLAGFRALGKRLGIDRDEVDRTLDLLAVSIPMYAKAAQGALPAAIKEHPLSVAHIAKAQELFDVRCIMMLGELENAKRHQGRRKHSESDTESFSFDATEDEAGKDHVEAERRRSWVPGEVRAAPKRRP